MCREIAKEETLDCFFVPSPAGNTCFSLLSACHFAPFFESSITVDFHIGEQDSRFLLKNQIFSVECPKLFPCVSLFGKFFSTWRITSFSALPTPHTAIFSLKIDTHNGHSRGAHVPAIWSRPWFFPAEVVGGARNTIPQKKVERRGSGRRCEVCRMSPGQQSVDRSLPFLIGILKR